MSTVDQKIVIDCDTGVDDAVALLLAIAAKNIDLLAVTCVQGNCTVDQAVHNTLITLGVAKKKVPVYRGCSRPLSVEYELGDVIHAEDGLSGASKEFEPYEECRQSEHAVNALVSLVNKHPGEITLIALGPLTNLAMCYRMDDNFSSKLKKLVIMGGNTEGKGNKKLAAEFNFVTDPEAAQIVVEETLCDCQICGWETCALNHTIPWEWFDQWMHDITSEEKRFMQRILMPFKVIRKERWPEHGFAICDPVAVAIALYPEIITNSTKQKITVETAGRHSRGLMVVEWKAGLFPRDTKPAELILNIDMDRYIAILEKISCDNNL